MQINTLKNKKLSSTKKNIEKQIDPLQDGISSISLIRISGSDVDIVNAARVSYGKFVDTVSERDEKLISFLIKHNHTSPFEHNQLSFRIKAPIFVSRQWMRHRMNSYNEISYRYVKAPFAFYTPPKWRFQDLVNKQASIGSFENEKLKKQYNDAIAVAVKTYESLLEQGVCRELARGVLPLTTYTQFIFTCNLHSLMHFLKLRLHPGAQFEIQQFAHAMFYFAKPHFPIALQEFERIHLQHIDMKTDEFTPNFTKTAG